MVVRRILNPLSTACADLLAPDSYLVHNRCEYMKIKFSQEDMLRAAVANFHQQNGSWWLISVVVVRVSDWFFTVVKSHPWENPEATADTLGHTLAAAPLNSYVPSMPPQLVLQGVSFPCFALLALHVRCQHTFDRDARRWTLNFDTMTKCAAALDVEWTTIEYWSDMGIKMEYSHMEPGKVTVSVFRPVQQLIAALTTPTDEH